MREIVLDTETTGFEPKEGHRLVEIGCVELLHQLPTGKTFHKYINPERDMPDDAFRIHGLSTEFLSEQALFADIADDFLTFINDSPLIIHNAAFDMKFLNAELRWLKKNEIPMTQAIDTLDMARKKFPGSPATLDALCRRFDINNDNRVLHGALLDSELLAEVYLELLGGRQRGLSFMKDTEKKATEVSNKNKEPQIKNQKQKREARIFSLPAHEQAQHKILIENIEDSLWKNK